MSDRRAKFFGKVAGRIGKAPGAESPGDQLPNDEDGQVGNSEQAPLEASPAESQMTSQPKQTGAKLRAILGSALGSKTEKTETPQQLEPQEPLQEPTQGAVQQLDAKWYRARGLEVPPELLSTETVEEPTAVALNEASENNERDLTQAEENAPQELTTNISGPEPTQMDSMYANAYSKDDPANSAYAREIFTQATGRPEQPSEAVYDMRNRFQQMSVQSYTHHQHTAQQQSLARAPPPTSAGLPTIGGWPSLGMEAKEVPFQTQQKIARGRALADEALSADAAKRSEEARTGYLKSLELLMAAQKELTIGTDASARARTDERKRTTALIQQIMSRTEELSSNPLNFAPEVPTAEPQKYNSSITPSQPPSSETPDPPGGSFLSERPTTGSNSNLSGPPSAVAGAQPALGVESRQVGQSETLYPSFPVPQSPVPPVPSRAPSYPSVGPAVLETMPGRSGSQEWTGVKCEACFTEAASVKLGCGHVLCKVDFQRIQAVLNACPTCQRPVRAGDVAELSIAG